MNDEYLWNKTGEDPEILKLENALAVFRYRETVKPAPTPDVIAPRWRISLSFAFAFASCVAVAFIAVNWMELSNDMREAEDEVVFVQPSDVPDPAPVIQPSLPATQNSNSQHRAPDTRKHTISRTTAAVDRRPRTQDSSPKDSVAALTAEERFAYRQLMLALSITGSKLKIVQDAIDGTEDTNDDSKNQR